VRGDAPLVTIAVPVRNGEAFLAGALDSALAQAYPNLEILISDNASVASGSSSASTPSARRASG
jgi:cellulose synthase/poly-beta-1,6-N-acetylglucosamine synthase-like glycosyltransferase